MEPFVYAPPPVAPLPVLYEDEALLALNKPAGLLSVPGRLEAHRDSLYTRVLVEHPHAMVVHRLDLATSGVIVIAKNLEANRALSRQFQQRRVEKTYLAVIEGTPAQNEGWLISPSSVTGPTGRGRWWITPSENRRRLSGQPCRPKVYRIVRERGLSFDRSPDAPTNFGSIWLRWVTQSLETGFTPLRRARGLARGCCFTLGCSRCIILWTIALCASRPPTPFKSGPF